MFTAKHLPISTHLTSLPLDPYHTYTENNGLRNTAKPRQQRSRRRTSENAQRLHLRSVECQSRNDAERGAVGQWNTGERDAILSASATSNSNAKCTDYRWPICEYTNWSRKLSLKCFFLTFMITYHSFQSICLNPIR